MSSLISSYVRLDLCSVEIVLHFTTCATYPLGKWRIHTNYSFNSFSWPSFNIHSEITVMYLRISRLLPLKNVTSGKVACLDERPQLVVPRGDHRRETICNDCHHARHFWTKMSSVIYMVYKIYGWLYFERRSVLMMSFDWGKAAYCILSYEFTVSIWDKWSGFISRCWNPVIQYSTIILKALLTIHPVKDIFLRCNQKIKPPLPCPKLN